MVSLCFIVSDLTASAMVKTEQGTKIIKENIGLSALSTEVAGGFVGCTLGLYAVDTESKEDEYALFKYLSYERD
jgi:alpha-N-arabinofuranosidase